MILGVVSNCWQCQLGEGIPLEKLVAKALERNFRAIELRQSYLGRFEDRRGHFPRVEALATLPLEFPEIRFNLALAFPFLNPKQHDPTDPLFVTGVEAAEALSGQFFPHLRLVDLATTAEILRGGKQEAVIKMANLARSLGRIHGVLSLENSRQPWNLFSVLVTQVRCLLWEEQELGVCYDPANLLLAPDRPNPNQVVRNMEFDALAMVHIKQFRGAEFQVKMGPGEIDWQTQITVLKSANFEGPALFEIRPDQAIWEHLDQSRSYVERLAKEE